LRAVDGYLSVPQEPGLGIDLDDENVSRLRVA
jgi:L-alanine-DL-glutamate epimerase-like enolase superfamily enzyme